MDDQAARSAAEPPCGTPDTARRARAHRTIDRALAAVLAHDMGAFAALWAPDGTMDLPFAGPGAPRHLAGRAAVADYVAGYNDLVLPGRVVAQTRHETGDPDTLVVEFTVAGRVVATGADYRLSYVAVLTVGDQGIASYRDYWSPMAVREVMGVASLAEVAR